MFVSNHTESTTGEGRVGQILYLEKVNFQDKICVSLLHLSFTASEAPQMIIREGKLTIAEK